MGNEEPMYCSQQINIPPELPNILKQFTKAAIRTQPSDILQVNYLHSQILFCFVKKKLIHNIHALAEVKLI